MMCILAPDNSEFHLTSKEVTSVAMLYVFARLMSQLADVNTQSSVGTFHLFMIYYFVITTSLLLGHVHILSILSQHYFQDTVHDKWAHVICSKCLPLCLLQTS